LEDLLKNFEAKLDISIDYVPFLCEKRAIEFVRNGKVMFVMRGLPGSGKSTLCNRIATTYTSDATGPTIVCSGDDFFTDITTGEYKFDAEMLSEAHEFARTKAIEACKLVSNYIKLFTRIKT
jgi:adenylylsulfate kinase-like enzyme